MKVKSKSDYRKRRHYRVRNKIAGTAARPRMAVFRSSKHLYIQFIDDDTHATLASASTQAGSFKGEKASVETAAKLGEAAAQAAKDNGIENVVFDRGGFAFAGKVKAIAEAAREAGLKF